MVFDHNVQSEPESRAYDRDKEAAIDSTLVLLEERFVNYLPYQLEVKER
jgi:hypothetical protein